MGSSMVEIKDSDGTTKNEKPTAKRSRLAVVTVKSGDRHVLGANKDKGPKVSKGVDTVYATGKRKNAIAKAWLYRGTGVVIVNGKLASEYLKRAILEVIINQPFAVTGTDGKFDVNCTVLGGGLSGQAGAIKHAISIALQLLDPELRKTLKVAGFLTRDSRIVERKKAGLKKARKGQVYQKR